LWKRQSFTAYTLFAYFDQPDRSYRSDIYYEKTTGLLAAIDDSVCMVEAAKYFMDFEKGLSCGKCVPCRLGMVRMHESMTRIAAGEGSAADWRKSSCCVKR